MRTTEFKDTELGPIPKDWEVKRLGEVATRIGVGLATSVTQYYRNEGTVLFRNLNIKPGRLDDQDVLYLDDVFAKSQPGKLIHEGDVLSVHTGYVGISCVVPKKHEGSLTFTTLITTPNRNNLLSEYMVVYMNSDLGAAEVESLQSSGGRSNLNVVEFERLRIPLPPLPEQRRIAAALGDVDKLIENLKKRVEKKKNLKRGAMQELLTGKRRLRGLCDLGVRKEGLGVSRGERRERGELFTATTEFKDTELGPIPKDWEVKRLGEMLTIGNGRDYKHLGTGDVPVYGTGGLMTYVDDFLFEGATVCFGRKGTIDEPQYHEGKIWTVDTLYFTYNFIDTDPKWLYYRSLLIDWLSYNTASGVPSLTARAICGISVSVPPFPEQRAIAAVLSDMDAEIANLEAKLKKMTLLKQGMMQDLLTGKVRLT